jgi:hypothetical protein
MKAKAKSFIILVVTFALGILLGVVISNTFVRSHFRGKIDRLRTPEGFIGMYERIIVPEETQSDTLQVILRNHFEKMRIQGEEGFNKFRALEDSLYQALEPLLTPEQNQRLQEHRERMQRRREKPDERKYPAPDQTGEK